MKYLTYFFPFCADIIISNGLRTFQGLKALKVRFFVESKGANIWQFQEQALEE